MSLLKHSLLSPFEAFFKAETSSGFVLMLGAVIALLWANSPWSESYMYAFEPLRPLINDGLMTIFFFLIGLELKREFAQGELSHPRKAALPIFAAIGGMIVPALIYSALNAGTPAERGWGIPMATDIAFAVGTLALLGPRVPLSFRVFLLALAIVDDLGAVLVIAFFYTDTISGAALGAAGALLSLIFMLSRAGVKSISFYICMGVFVWLCFLKSGVHPTITGVILGLMTPLTPLHLIERRLHPWVSFGIMPIFALANAGVSIAGIDPISIMSQPTYLGIFLGLLIGKPVGIFLFSYLSIKLKLASLPQGVSYKTLFATGILGGIGFTMALFVSGLALSGHEMEIYSKAGILSSSVCAGVIGYFALRFTLRGHKR